MKIIISTEKKEPINPSNFRNIILKNEKFLLLTAQIGILFYLNLKIEIIIMSTDCKCSDRFT